jgi:hypothetical protein
MKSCQNFIKRKHPRKGEEKKKNGPGPKSRQANSPKDAGHKKVMEPLSTETSTKSAPLNTARKLPTRCYAQLQFCNLWTNKAKVIIKYGVISASENPLKVELMFLFRV